MAGVFRCLDRLGAGSGGTVGGPSELYRPDAWVADNALWAALWAAHSGAWSDRLFSNPPFRDPATRGFCPDGWRRDQRRRGALVPGRDALSGDQRFDYGLHQPATVRSRRRAAGQQLALAGLQSGLDGAAPAARLSRLGTVGDFAAAAGGLRSGRGHGQSDA